VPPATPDRDLYEAQYEALRSQMIGTAGAAPRGVGLALLLQQGLAAWIAAVQRCAPSCPPVVVADKPTGRADHDDSAAVAGTIPVDVLPRAQYPEVTRLLAGLVLSAHAGGRGRGRDEGGSARC
jgi:hypothetical protein